MAEPLILAIAAIACVIAGPVIVFRIQPEPDEEEPDCLPYGDSPALPDGFSSLHKAGQ